MLPWPYTGLELKSGTGGLTLTGQFNEKLDAELRRSVNSSGDFLQII
jgi:hypothetical protein